MDRGLDGPYAVTDDDQLAALAEALESTFYTQALAKFTSDDFTQAGFDGAAVMQQITYVLKPPLP